MDRATRGGTRDGRFASLLRRVQEVPRPVLAIATAFVVAVSAVLAFAVFGGSDGGSRAGAESTALGGGASTVDGGTGTDGSDGTGRDGSGAGSTTTAVGGSGRGSGGSGSGGTGSGTGGTGTGGTGTGGTGTGVGGAGTGGGSATTTPPGGTAPPGTGPSTAELQAAYAAAFTAECTRIWSFADGDGLLWDPEDPTEGPFTVQDCLDELDTDLVDGLYETLAEAREAGTDDALWAADLLTLAGELMNTAGNRVVELF